MRAAAGPETGLRTADPRRNEKPRRSGAFRGLRGGDQTMLTVRRLFGPLTENATLPSTSANRV
jgi:hypothetical protein